MGNSKTRDKVIRRRINLEEGNLVTTRAMDDSKSRVENLGYFDTRDGVNWKIRRIAENLVDLDLMLKEIKTGHANLKMGYGGTGDISSPISSFSVGGEVVDTNFLGSGISFALNANLSKDERNIFFNITQPWLMDKPITAALDIYHRRPTYEDFNNIGPVNEILTGGSLTFGFVTPLLYDTQVLFRGGVDSLRYDKAPRVLSNINNPIAVLEYQHVLNQMFTPGDFVWFTQNCGQDRRNNPLHTSRGYRWNTNLRFGLPTTGSNNIGFYRFDAEAYWWTPLIGEYDLVFKLHGFAGFAGRLKNHIIPYRELFHIGGPASVRGFLFGQIGPMWQDAPASTRGTDSLGSGKAFFVNAELIFPIKPDLTVKGVAFYDGGDGWDFPYANEISPQRLVNNNFSYRHAVGVGIRMLEPMPLRIDWGFKIDPIKAFRETGSEVHLSMTYDW
jgi:outer membrane protein insertion porin family